MGYELKVEKYAFEPFGSLEGLLKGEPIKIMPVGKFYRDDRILNISISDLKTIAKNVNAGLPRFRIPINENHAGNGKVGTVQVVEYQADGADGAGLYATKYELTDVGKALVEQKKYDAVSPELVWTKNDGAKYQDPNTGEWHDNVMVGLALTDRPFFGHEHVALYSAMPSGDRFMADLMGGMKEMMLKMADMLKKMMTMMDGNTEKPEGMSETNMLKAINDLKRLFNERFVDQRAKDEENPLPELPKGEPMSDKPDVDTFAIDPETFKALQAQLKNESVKAETFRADYEKERDARQLDALKMRVDNYVAIPFPVDEFAVELHQLQKIAPDLFKKFADRFEALDKTLAQAELFNQRASERTGGVAENFEDVIEAVIKENYGGDRSKYAEAMDAAGKKRPDLMTAYLNK